MLGCCGQCGHGAGKSSKGWLCLKLCCLWVCSAAGPHVQLGCSGEALPSLCNVSRGFRALLRVKPAAVLTEGISGFSPDLGLCTQLLRSVWGSPVCGCAAESNDAMREIAVQGIPAQAHSPDQALLPAPSTFSSPFPFRWQMSHR